jgi:hypothetical protein
MSTLTPYHLKTEELLRYAQLYLDKKENIPMLWQQELLRLFLKEIDAAREAEDERDDT